MNQYTPRRLLALRPQKLPRQFGRYRISRPLGEGGMATVYLAHDTQSDRPVALKVPHFSAENTELLRRFYRETRVAGAIVHPNICPLYDVGEIHGIPYLAMPYIEGKLLWDYIAEGKPLDPPAAATLVRKLALALHHAHEQGVIHRDLKPLNVIIDKAGEPILMDFGLARCLGDADQDLTQAGQILGTAYYMAPEQALGKKTVIGPAADIYSLGVIFFELLTARLPYDGETMDVIKQILVDPPPHVRRFRRNIPKTLDAICAKAMAKTIKDRFASMAEFAAALTEFLEQAPEAAPLPASEPELTIPTDWKRVVEWVAVALGAGVMMIMLVLLFNALFRK
jgi:serine/threonine protein kinase